MKIIFIGLLFLGISPAFVILFLYIYKLYIDSKIKKFENNGCVVLTWEKIENILAANNISYNISKTLNIFKSAVCDHSIIDGIRYYTKLPFGQRIIIAHDNHRKSLIAHEIGKMLVNEKITSNEDLNICADILLNLINNHQIPHYAQLIIWDSLSKLAYFQKMDLIKKIGIDSLKNYIIGDFMRGIAIIKFIFNLKGYKYLDNEMKEFLNEIIFYIIEEGNRTIVALLVFKINKSPYFAQIQKEDFIKHLPKIVKFNTFLKNIDNLYSGFLQEEMIEGLKSLGLQPPLYSRKNTEGKIVQILINNFLEEIYVPISYSAYTFEKEENREKLLDFLWFEDNNPTK